jgi:hypothetical protein
MEENMVYYVEKEVFHRIIKGKEDLIIEIEED